MTRSLFRYAFLALFCLFSFKITGQNEVPAKYTALVQNADSLLQAKMYLPAAHTYTLAFKSFQGKGFIPDRYQAAKAWAMAEVADSAFVQLEKIVYRGKFDDYFPMQGDTAFLALKDDPRWEPIMLAVRKNHGIVDAVFDYTLFKLIDSLVKEDQKWRNRWTHLTNTAGWDSVQLKQVGRRIVKVDSTNYPLLVQIIEKHGFPTQDKIGKLGANNFWLLVQHQDSQVGFQKKVLKLMESELAKNKVSAVDYAYLVDRVKVNSGELQVYGTQFDLNAEHSSFTPKPVIDPPNLNARREKMGLGTIESYMETANRRYHGTLKKE
jgi:hypothetical protein